MGNSRYRRTAFFAQHPMCCFCGGGTPATTEDHVPSRAFFNGRRWPEGFNFPACARCNYATANIEQLAALICRIGNLEATQDETDQNLALMRGIENNFPGLLGEMRQGPVDKRRWLREQGLQLGTGETSADLGLFSVEDERIQAAMREFGRKLLLALFYRHTKTIFPQDGSFAFRWFSNANFDDIHPIVKQITPGIELPFRMNSSLGDQFYCRHGVAKGQRATAFIAFFHESAAILGVMFAYDFVLDQLRVGAVLKPYKWA